MKKFYAVMVVLSMLLFAGIALAETFSVTDCLTVSADKSGLVTATGKAADVQNIIKAIIFCPDRYKGGCWDNYPIKTNFDGTVTATFQMDMERVRSNQRSFNYKSNGRWLLIPHPLVRVGSNLILEISAPSEGSENGRGGAHFTFIGDNSSYQPLVPIYSGGACGGTAVKASIKQTDGLVGRKVSGKGDATAKSVIKGNNNDVTQQPVKQVQKPKQVIKGNNNTAVQKSHQSNVNIRTRDNSPVIVNVHQGSPPELYDGTCLKCHKGVVKTTDPHGNVKIEKSTSTTKEVKKK